MRGENLALSDGVGQSRNFDDGVHEGNVYEVTRPEQDGVLVAKQGFAGPVAGIHHKLAAVQGRAQQFRGGLRRLGAPLLLGQAALGAVGPAKLVVGLVRCGRELRPGLLAAVDAILAEGVKDGGPLLEVCLDGLGGADGLALGGEQRGQEAAGIFCKAEDEEGDVCRREARLGVRGRREEGVDPGEEAGADAEGWLLDAGGVQPQEGREEDVQEDGTGVGIRRGHLGSGAWHGQGALQAVREEVCAPLALDNAGTEDRAEVWEGRELRRVLPMEHQGPEGKSQVQTTPRRGGREEVRVDLGLSVVVVGECGVEAGYVAVELG